MTNLELPNFMNYAGKYSPGNFMETISRIARRAGSRLVYVALILYYTLQSDSVTRKDKLMIVGALGYLVSLFDVVPDAIPIVGLGDDFTVLLYVLKKVWTDVSQDVKDKAHSRLSKWFDDEEMSETDNIFDAPDV